MIDLRSKSFDFLAIFPNFKQTFQAKPFANKPKNIFASVLLLLF
jgi:hypothetical protein